MVIRQTIATHSAAKSRVHFFGDVNSGCVAVTQRPVLCRLTKCRYRVLFCRVLVLCQRSIHDTQTGSTPFVMSPMFEPERATSFARGRRTIRSVRTPGENNDTRSSVVDAGKL